MIVICTKCQAKFRVADDKIGPRGAKVRCSRCETTFLVHPDLGTIPAGDAPQPAAPAAQAHVPAAAPQRPPPLPPPLPVRTAPDGPPQDPFAGFAPPPADPFAASDPFAPAAPETPRPSLAVTDLSDLLGPAARASDPFEASPGLASSPPEPSAPAAPFDDGLALEERITPPPARVLPPPEPEPALDIAAAPAFEAGPGPDSFGGVGGGFDRAGDEPLAIAGRDAPFDLPASPVAPEAPPRTRRPSATGGPSAAREPDERIAPPRSSRLRAVVVNAIALAALLLVALSMLVVWRTEGPLAPGALRPAAILAALMGGGVPSGAFATTDVRSGVYERAHGAPLLFVRGNVVSRSAAPVRALEVSVAVVRGGEVIARGAAIAGALPTPEELHRAGDGAALAQAIAAARARAPARVSPGDVVPFLVAIGDVPQDLDGASIRLEVGPAGGRP